MDLLQLLDLLPNLLEILVEVLHGCQLQDTHTRVTPYMKHACISATQSISLTSCGLISHNLEDDGSQSSCIQLELKGLSV